MPRIECSPDEILITSGSLQGLDLVNTLLLGKGDTVLIEKETYGGALTQARQVRRQHRSASRSTMTACAWMR